jgi:hypothetical protein
MEGNLSAVAKTAKQLALLAETLERRCGAAVSIQEKAAVELCSVVGSARTTVDQFFQSAHRAVEQSTRQCLDRELDGFARAGRGLPYLGGVGGIQQRRGQNSGGEGPGGSL